jgi:hypothetical protein
MAKGWIGMPGSLACRRRHRNGEWRSCSGASQAFGTAHVLRRFLRQRNQQVGRNAMGKGILLWLIGIPLPIIILLLLFWR